MGIRQANWIGVSCVAAVAVLAAGAITGPSDPAPIVQPVAFDHKLHAAEELSCVDCHRYAERRAYAGFPAIRGCLLCHEEELGEHPDEPRIREYAERGVEIPWVQVNTYPGHVYFSHVAHVKFAEIACSECHGNMEEASAPVSLSQIDHLDMDHCMACHESAGASNDCLACHK